MAKLYYAHVPTPVGKLTVVVSDRAVHRVLWKPGHEGCAHAPSHPLIRETARQLEEYFGGKRARFELPLEPEGTEFQLRAWLELREIPFGEKISYQEQARRLGDVRKARAVGAANARNPLGILVPCHRVVGKNGKLTGFAGGIEAKKRLLELEHSLGT